MDFTQPISAGDRSLKMYATRLAKLGIVSLHDLLYHIPSRYEDYSLHSTIAQVQEGELVTLQGQITDLKNTYTRSHKTLQKVTITDGTGSITLHWFNQPYIVSNLTEGETLSVSGRIEIFAQKKSLIAPEYEVVHNTPPLHTGRIIPIYPETRGVSSKWLRRRIAHLLSELDDQLEFMPDEIKQQHDLLDLSLSLRQIHFPNSLELAEKARRRLSFDEVFLLQLSAQERKKQWRVQKKGKVLQITKDQLDQFVTSLPFVLTGSQTQAVLDLVEDLELDHPMNRLLQGDVGSGKTVIAAIGCYIAYLNGFQSALMAPTEILAQQHFSTLGTLLKPFGIQVGLLTSSTKLARSTSYDVVVGTHALVAQNINFTRLAFIAIDEQQRFGVKQRGILREKGSNPHLLTMTATPIPRTVALTLYGELDVSYLTEMPKGRKKIKTWLVPNEKREGAYHWIREQIRLHNSQAFIICPFIEESENMQSVKAARTEFELLQTKIFPDLRLGLLHGKLKAKEKEEVLKTFHDRKLDILVATPVVEVGIDIPTATIMLIEGSERFGLAQLHQLRGRVGRNDMQSYCLLFTEATSDSSLMRLKAMETISQGAALAEYDLKLRGPGEMYGVRQSGTRTLKIASFSDLKLLEEAKRTAIDVFKQLENYPELEKKVKEATRDAVVPD
ncbi:MAG TPA: ATP-dependent DNA helicase RecG [Patescibacteria group bacterium]|nr:ATP-dependent DNA helicase RecG [Patescibacteria group bacterium]